MLLIPYYDSQKRDERIYHSNRKGQSSYYNSIHIGIYYLHTYREQTVQLNCHCFRNILSHGVVSESTKTVDYCSLNLTRLQYLWIY